MPMLTNQPTNTTMYFQRRHRHQQLQHPKKNKTSDVRRHQTPEHQEEVAQPQTTTERCPPDSL